VTVPVSDIDRAKKFYESLGWRLDIDLVVSDDIRLLQMTPPHSQCSIHFGKGLYPPTAMAPGSLDRVYLAVDDIDAAREDLIRRGVDVSAVEDFPWGSFVFFSDPDGNGWSVQQIPARG